MFGRSGSVALLAIVLLAPTRAHAKTQNFFSGSPFGLGVLAGAENRPNHDFTAGNHNTVSGYAGYFGIEPFFDLGNVCFRGHASWHFYPRQDGSGSDSIGNFTESSDTGSLSYGVRVQLSPFIDEKARGRFFLVMGFANAVIKAKNLRKYSTGAQSGRTNAEQLEGSGLEVNGGIGYEFFLVQNWSMALEGGYTTRGADTFHYRTSTDVQGNTRSGTDVLHDAKGNDKGFHTWSPYGQLVLNLNL